MLLLLKTAGNIFFFNDIDFSISSLNRIHELTPADANEIQAEVNERTSTKGFWRVSYQAAHPFNCPSFGDF